MALGVIVGLVLVGILIKVIADDWNRQRAAEHEERGRRLAGQGRHADALEAYGAALGLAPDSPRLHTRRGRALWALGRREEALDAYWRAAGLDAGNGAAHVDVARALVSLRRAPEALASAERAVSLSPRSPDARMAKGEALLAYGMRREAVAEMRESARLRDGAGVRMSIANILRGLGDHAGELVELDLAIAAGGEGAGLHYRRGCALFFIGKASAAERPQRYREAVEAFEAALRLDEHHAEASMALEHARGQLEALGGGAGGPGG